MAPRRCFAPNNVAPFAGAVSDTVGAWFALGATVMLTAVDVVVDPTLSRAGYVDRCSLKQRLHTPALNLKASSRALPGARAPLLRSGRRAFFGRAPGQHFRYFVRLAEPVRER